MKTTRYFQTVRSRKDRSIIKDEWIQHVIENPESEQIQGDGRIRRWARIEAMQGKYLRVVLLQDAERFTTHFLIGAISHEG